MKTAAMRMLLASIAFGPAAALGQTEPSCCDAEVNLGFSEVLVRGGALFEGIAGLGERCTASEGEIISGGPAASGRRRA